MFVIIHLYSNYITCVRQQQPLHIRVTVNGVNSNIQVLFICTFMHFCCPDTKNMVL